MKRTRLSDAPKILCYLAISLICLWPLSGPAWGQTEPVVVVPPPDLNPLNQIPIPEPMQLSEFVKNKAAAIRLGKAFFWDMQAGSDGIVACATCHFHAGADPRMKNQLNPGTKSGDTLFGNNSLGDRLDFPQFKPNYTLQATDFPLHQRAEPSDSQLSSVLRDTNDVVSSQGIRLGLFRDIIPGSAEETVDPIPDPVFNLNGANIRQVQGRHTPSVINAVFNFTQFWDGRANFLFNGENPFGPADPDAGVWYDDPANPNNLVKRPVTIQFASLASQATGPPLSDSEMSARGRTFPQFGRKLLSLTPLGKQLVHPGDSVLGPLSQAVLQPDGRISGIGGLSTTYREMIQEAFHDGLWNSAKTTPDSFTQMEANFSLFWGLAIQLYEATLVSDQTPFDRWLAGDANALTDQQKRGFFLFNSTITNCFICHVGIEFTTSSASNIAFLNNFINGTIELMAVGNGTQVLYDEGFNNTAVTPTTDDLGRGENAPFINPLTNEPIPLSFSKLAVLQRQEKLPFETPILDLFLPENLPVNANGLFKVPGLRNVELTAPYFHNGSMMTLEQVIDFYVRGGNFPWTNIDDIDPIIGNGIALMQGKEEMRADLVAFLKSLTDERVRNESAPFDHPEIFIPEGEPEVLTRLPARDATGAAATPVLSLDAVDSPTAETSQVISGSVEAGLTPVVSVNTTATAGPVTVNGTTWSCQITGLVDGDNILTVSVTDSANHTTSLTATIVFSTKMAGPVAVNDVATTSVGVQVTIDILANDSGPDGTLAPASVSIKTLPAHGSCLVNPATGEVTYIPAFNYSGIDSFTYTVRDDKGRESNVATVSVTIGGSGPGAGVKVLKALVSARTAAPTWDIRGEGTPNSTVQIFLGPNLSGESIGTATVNRLGKWRYRGRKAIASPVSTVAAISVSSSNGEAVLDHPLLGVSRAVVSTKGRLAAEQGPRWAVQGTGTPNATITISMAGQTIGTATVTKGGTWRFVGRSLTPVNGTEISVTSSAGGKIVNYPNVIVR